MIQVAPPRHKQLLKHDPANGVYGDCFRTCIACLLERPVTEVPHFCDGGKDDVWLEDLYKYLAPRGYYYVEFRVYDIGAWKDMSRFPYDIYHIITDVSPNFPDTMHAVIGKNGEVWHDPAPSNKGLPVITEARSFGFLLRLVGADRPIRPFSSLFETEQIDGTDFT